MKEIVTEYSSNNNKTVDKILFPKRKRYLGFQIDKISKGDYSLGFCFSYDGWLGECYLYLNLFKWTISIGMLSKEIERNED